MPILHDENENVPTGTGFVNEIARISRWALFALISIVATEGTATGVHATDRHLPAGQQAHRDAEARRTKHCASPGRAAVSHAPPHTVTVQDYPLIPNEVADIVAGILDISPEAVKISSDLVCGVGVDSLEAVEIVIALEEKYGISIPDDDAIRMTNYVQLIEYIESKITTSRT